MHIPFLDDFKTRARENPRRIVLPEGSDERIIQAAVQCAQQRLVKPILLGNPNEVQALAQKLALNTEAIELIDPANHDHTEAYAQMLYNLRKAKGLTPEQAKQMVQQPLVFANCMVRAGDADGCVAGVAHPTADVVRTALQVIGVAEGVKLVSSFFIMVLPEQTTQPVLFADCALNIDPDSAQLADIALTSAASAQSLLGLKPRVALLSFSTNGSAKHPQVDKVREATQLVKEANGQIGVIGDVQFDAAFSAPTLAGKWPDSDFNAPANVFIFPSLEAGNIGYKIAERLGKALPIGPVLQGLNKPVNDLSRGSDVGAVINTIVVTAVQAQ